MEPIEVPRLDLGKLALRAVEHRARPEVAQGHLASAKAESSESTGRASLNAWKAAYLRHRLTLYDQLLDGLPGRTRSSERAEAVTPLRRRIYATIAAVYPAQAQECARQLHEQGLGPLDPLDPLGPLPG
ncbi:hypothetical protein AB0D78_01520 [Streptomyces avermitilis]|uniref:hypothetical protein n=1 Tax=Streptomyces avermitilis TaxID=33903 RepID=UPI0034049BCB